MPKGIYDRASSAWQPPRRVDSPELIEAVRRAYVDENRTIAEVGLVIGSSAKVVRDIMVRNGIPRRVAHKRDQRGAKNHMWRGEDAGYQALHLRVQAARGAPSECVACGATAPDQRYEWANLTGRWELISDYIRLCESCHRRFDAARRRWGDSLRRPKGGGAA